MPTKPTLDSRPWKLSFTWVSGKSELQSVRGSPVQTRRLLAELKTIERVGLAPGEASDVWSLLRGHPDQDLRAAAKQAFERHAGPRERQAVARVGNGRLWVASEADLAEALHRIVTGKGIDPVRVARRFRELTRRGSQFLIEQGGAPAIEALRSRLQGTTLYLGGTPPAYRRMVMSQSELLGPGSMELAQLPPELAQVRFDRLRAELLGLRSAGPVLGQLPGLRELNLAMNEIGKLGPELGKLARLERLELHANPLREIAAPVFRLSNLKYLGLGGTRIKEIPPAISLLKNLEELAIWGTGVAALPPELVTLPSLRKLNVFKTPLAADAVALAALKKALRGVVVRTTS